MAYNPTTDFVGLWRAISGGVEKSEMPGLDFWVAALHRSGILKVVVSQTPPVVNQSTTAWFQPANPSYSAEGSLYLWDAGANAYAPATSSLFFAIGQSAGEAINISEALDQLGSVQGDVLFRNTSSWDALPPGASGQVLASSGPGANPHWVDSTTTGSAILNYAAFPVEERFTVPGNVSWTVPPTVTVAEISCYGGGGGGGAGNSGKTGGGGGGAGGYTVKKYTNLVPGAVVGLTIGDGGSGGLGGASLTNGSSGTSTSYAGLISAAGGAFGGAGGDVYPGTLGAGGMGSGGTVNIRGGSGSTGASGPNGVGGYTGLGGAGGSCPGPEGGKGGPMTTGSSGPGQPYGAGGSGGGSGAGTNTSAGAGADGLILIRYVLLP